MNGFRQQTRAFGKLSGYPHARPGQLGRAYREGTDEPTTNTLLQHVNSVFPRLWCDLRLARLRALRAPHVGGGDATPL
jgi:hypothetical protein